MKEIETEREIEEKFYVYTSFGIERYCLTNQGKYHFLINKDGEEIIGSELSIAPLPEHRFETKEEAIIDHYKTLSKRIYDKIAKNKEYIRKAEQERRELYEKFKETIENNPHLMIV